MIVLSTFAGAISAVLLLVMGHSLGQALLWGYVGGGMVTLLVLAAKMVVCEWLNGRAGPHGRFNEQAFQQPVQRATTRNVWAMVARSSRRLNSRE
jgi:hypothetical protein